MAGVWQFSFTGNVLNTSAFIQIGILRDCVISCISSKASATCFPSNTENTFPCSVWCKRKRSLISTTILQGVNNVILKWLQILSTEPVILFHYFQEGILQIKAYSPPQLLLSIYSSLLPIQSPALTQLLWES